MAAEIIKVYKEHLPSLRLIGKCYSNNDRDQHGSFAGKWGEWMEKGWLEPLEALGYLAENGNACLGAMRFHNGQFEYWIGAFFAADTAVPEGYSYADIPEGPIGVCWIYGRDDNGELYGMEPHNACVAKWSEQGWEARDNAWFFERYHNPRFTTPDDQGNVILDYCMYIK
jgi:predicted transcriptional regulator YdeE